MALIKGWIVDTLSAYEAKQIEIGNAMGLEFRYAGRVVEGVVYPDIILNSGEYFIPDSNGTDTITKEDIKHENDLI